jgi:hypothetical protein
MKTILKNYGQLVIIILLIAFLVYSNYSRKGKINVGVLNSSLFVDEKINESTQTLKGLNLMLYDSLMNKVQLHSVKQKLKSVHLLSDSICHQIKYLKTLAIEMSGGLKVKDNFYTINNLGYNFGHSNKLTGDKNKNNGEGSKLKFNLDKLRSIEKKLINNSKENAYFDRFLNTSDKKEDNSDYIFSWEEQYFKLLPTVGVLNLLSIIENNTLNSEQIVLFSLLLKNSR